MAQVVQSGTGERGNTKTLSRARAWALTLNNYTQEEYDVLVQYFKRKCTKYIVGKEIGEEKTPHLQMYVRFKSGIRFKTLKDINNRLHIEKAKGTDAQNWDYCSKDGDYVSNYDCMNPRERAIMLRKQEYKNVVWKKWQQDILDILDKKPNKRTIHWFWDETGNIGKSFLATYICMNYDVVVCDGKKNDVLNQVNTALEKYIPKVAILDIPRSSVDYINYSVIEKLKDGCLYSGKYEGGLCIFPQPHVIIFANCEPDRREMSADRWVITKL